MGLTSEQEAIYRSIPQGSDNDPRRPEFPPEAPAFPATPVVRLEVPGFTNVWVKDESYNPTGTHKDRLAWEVVVFYRSILAARLRRGGRPTELPACSIISSGSAATALQTMFRRYALPSLRVLVDTTTPIVERDRLQNLGCLVYTTDLAARVLRADDILKLTENEGGVDLTSADALHPSIRFYDWLAYEIVNESPEWCFMPYGTGNLFENVLNVAEQVVTSQVPDPRFQGNSVKVGDCNFIGATTADAESQAVKLYAPHLPFATETDQWLRMFREAGFCGTHTGVRTFKEESLNQAIRLLQKAGIRAEASAAAGLACFLEMQAEVASDEKVLIVATGRVREK